MNILCGSAATSPVTIVVHAMDEIVEAEGHLIDSQLLNAMFDTVVRHDAAFEVLEFRIGRTNDEPSFVSMRVTSSDQAGLTETLEELVGLGCRVAGGEDAHVIAADRDGCAPEDFYSTTNHRTSVRLDGEWVPVEQQRMDAAIVVDGRRAVCRKLRDIRAGDAIVCGIHGVKIVPEFQERDRLGFAFMSNENLVRAARGSRRRQDRRHDARRESRRRSDRLRRRPRRRPHRRRRLFLRSDPRRLRRRLLAGNALAVHDAEQALYGTSLGVDMESGRAIEGGHRHHMRAINAIYRAGGLRLAVEKGVLTSGVIYECIRRNVDFVLAGSIRDDGPLPDTVMNLVEAQDRYTEALNGVKLVLVLSTMLHGIGVGNMLPAWVRLVCVDINPAVERSLQTAVRRRPSASSRTWACFCATAGVSAA
jgi:hypothetical protein